MIDRKYQFINFNHTLKNKVKSVDDSKLMAKEISDVSIDRKDGRAISNFMSIVFSGHEM